MLVAASVAIEPGHSRVLYMSHITRHGCRCSQDLQPSAACPNLAMCTWQVHATSEQRFAWAERNSCALDNGHEVMAVPSVILSVSPQQSLQAARCFNALRA